MKLTVPKATIAKEVSNLHFKGKVFLVYSAVTDSREATEFLFREELLGWIKSFPRGETPIKVMG